MQNFQMCRLLQLWKWHDDWILRPDWWLVYCEANSNTFWLNVFFKLWPYQYTSRYRAFSLPGQFAPRSESANRTLANSLPGTFTPWPFRSLALSLLGLLAPWNFRSQAFLLPGTKVLWNFRSVEFSFPGTFAPLMCISPFAYTDRNV